MEATLERGILLDVLAVLVKGGGTHALDLPACHRRLEHVGRVDGTLGTTSAHQRVKFVNEQDDVARTANFVHHRFDALFELTAVLRTRHHHGQVKHHNTAIMQQIWHFFRDNGQTFRTAVARQLPPEERVVPGAAAEYLHQTFNLFRPTNHGVQFILLGEIGEIAAKVVEGRGAALPTWATCGVPAASPSSLSSSSSASMSSPSSMERNQNFFADFFELQTKVHQTWAATPSCSRSRPSSWCSVPT